jgi:hypothetical protein
MSYKLKNYFKPTPKRFRILGDSLASASVFISTYAVLEEYKLLAVFSLVTGWVGKFMTNFFTNEEPEKEEQISL